MVEVIGQSFRVKNRIPWFSGLSDRIQNIVIWCDVIMLCDVMVWCHAITNCWPREVQQHFLGRGRQLPRPNTISLAVLDSAKSESLDTLNPSARVRQYGWQSEHLRLLEGGGRLRHSSQNMFVHEKINSRVQDLSNHVLNIKIRGLEGQKLTKETWKI